MNNLIFNFNSSGYQHQSFFDFESKTSKVVEQFHGDDFEAFPCESLDIGFSESKIKELAEEISDKLIVIVKEQLHK